jgi:hypothetical protein
MAPRQEKSTMKFTTATLLAVPLASGTALAEATPPTAPEGDAAVVAKFEAADKNSHGALDDIECDADKADDKDRHRQGCKISQVEFVAAAKAGHIK